jgi:hypothetical protein
MLGALYDTKILHVECGLYLEPAEKWLTVYILADSIAVVNLRGSG